MRLLLLVGAQGHERRTHTVEGEQGKWHPGPVGLLDEDHLLDGASSLTAVLHGPPHSEPAIFAHPPDIAGVRRLAVARSFHLGHEAHEVRRGVRPSAPVGLASRSDTPWPSLVPRRLASLRSQPGAVFRSADPHPPPAHANGTSLPSHRPPCSLRPMAKTVFLGAGSTVFARNLLGDILGHEELADSEIVLHDIDTERLENVRARGPAGVRSPQSAGHDHRHHRPAGRPRRRRLRHQHDPGGRLRAVHGHGLRSPQAVSGYARPSATRVGIGGIMRGLRTIPVLLAMCADMEELCPDVWFLNYTNPMAINCRAINRASRIRTVGLCHSVQGTAFELSLDLGIPYGEIDYLAAGINHMAFYLKFERDGEDLYPRLHALAQSG